MAKKVFTQTIEVKGVKFNEIGKMLSSAEGKNYENILGALIAVQQTLAELEVVSESLQKVIDNTSVEEVKVQLKSRGLLDEGYEPMFKIPLVDNKGETTDTFNITLKQSEKVDFNISKDLKDCLSIVPKKYLEEKTVIKTKTVKDDYHSGTLDSAIEPYVSETKTPVTKVTKKKVYDEDAK